MKWISRILTTPVDEFTLSGKARAKANALAMAGFAIIFFSLMGYAVGLNWNVIWLGLASIGHGISYLTIGNIFDTVSAYPQLTLLIVCYLIFRFRAWLHSLPVIGSIAPFALAMVYFITSVLAILFLANHWHGVTEGVSNGNWYVRWGSLYIVFGLFEYISAHAIVVLLVVICILLYRRRRCL